MKRYDPNEMEQCEAVANKRTMCNRTSVGIFSTYSDQAVRVNADNDEDT